MERIGFIGLGVMGGPMAKHLIRAGYSLTVKSRSPRPAVDELVSLGAKAANSPREVARASDIVITMLPDSPDVELVALGPAGIIEGSRQELIYVDMSTISPQVTRKIASALGEKGVKVLDAPVSGGDKGAREATLSIMVGGPRDVFENVLPMFQAMGKNIVHLGGIGMGQVCKACNQVICALNNMAMCEGLMLAAKAGLNVESMVKVASAGLGQSRMIDFLFPRIVKGDYEPGFKAKLQAKDLKIALSLADELKLPMLGTSMMLQLFRTAEEEGIGEKGTQALLRVMEKLAGTNFFPDTSD